VAAYATFIQGIVGGGGGSTPTAPRNVKARGGNDKINVTWKVPVSDGGSPITSYQITTTPATTTTTVPASQFKATLTGLANGTYTVTVKGVNANGAGAGASATATVT
jgi:hypothetical protein